jgi:hypothetical protein
MTKYYIEMKGFGKSSYLIAKPTSDAKAKQLKKEGVEVFSCREEAIEEIRKK